MSASTEWLTRFLPWDPPLPGVSAPSPELARALDEALRARGPSYEPRAQHRAEDGSPRYTNRLIRESSPYLLQHAHNPVSWWPWCDQAFARARREGKLVLLSVGYATCHWCHVMERESFEDEEIAAVINSRFVPIKVDREERPDVDRVYTMAVQMLSGRAGWPLTLFLTPDREPVFGGTYFPPRDGARGARVGFLTLLLELGRGQERDPEGLRAQGQRLAQHLRDYLAPGPPGHVPTGAAIHAAAEQLAESFDPEWGGFGGAPKFPRPATLGLLARYSRRTGDPLARDMVTATLNAMAQGGIRDHVGGGFHRYSVDERWRVPHFEKMLYDNAQLATAYLEGWQLCGHDAFAEVVHDTLAYLVREMRSDEGAFFGASDADSPDAHGEPVEGLFFTWTPAEIEAVVGRERAPLVCAHLGVTEEGELDGRSVLHVEVPLEGLATRMNVPLGDLRAELGATRAALYAARRRRPPPLVDTKVVTAWNALAVSAFARAGFAFARADHLEVASRAARFLLREVRHEGKLAHSWKDGVASGGAFLDDYAFFIAALVDLFEATGEPSWLREALREQQMLDERFWDEEAGGYFFSGALHEELLARDKPDQDGAEPAGNSVAAQTLLRLSELTGEERYCARAERLLAAFAEPMTRRGLALPAMLSALDFYLDRPLQIVLALGAESDALLAPLRRSFLPSAVRCLVRREHAQELSELVPLSRGLRETAGRSIAYVCRAQTCELPTSDPAELSVLLGRAEPLVTESFAPLATGEESVETAAWRYDAQADRHWHPGHGHWHKGPPPRVTR